VFITAGPITSCIKDFGNQKSLEQRVLAVRLEITVTFVDSKNVFLEDTFPICTIMWSCRGPDGSQRQYVEDTVADTRRMRLPVD